MTDKVAEVEPEVSRASRLTALESIVARLESELQDLKIHHHQMRSAMLNYVDKPVLIKSGSFVPVGDGTSKKTG